MERVYYTAFFLVRQVLLRKYHAAFTQIAQYFRVELQNCCETIQASENFRSFFQIITKPFAIQRKKGYTKRKRKKKKRTKRGSGTHERKRNHKCNVLSNQIAGGVSPPENDSVRSHLSGAGGRRDHPDDTRDASDDAGGRKRTADCKNPVLWHFCTAAVRPVAGDSDCRCVYSGRANPDDWRSGVRHGAGDSAQSGRVISGNGNCLLSGAVDWTTAFESLCKRRAPRTVFLFNESAENGTHCVSIIFVSGLAERCPDVHCRL